MAIHNVPDATFAFNNPVYFEGGWKVAIKVEREDAASRSKKRQKKVQGGARAHALLVSSVMLARHSEYFRRKVKAWSGADKTITLHVKPGNEQYAEELIRFFYTERVSYSAGPDLVKLLLLANEFLVPACEAQCTHLLKEGALTLETAMELFFLTPDESAPYMAELQSKTKEVLLARLGDLETVWASEELRDLFLELPLRMVEMLLQSSELKAMSENTVFVAAASWLHHNEKALGNAVQISWNRLQSHLRFVCMTPLFLADAVAQVPWTWWKDKCNVVAAAMKLQTASQMSWIYHLHHVSPDEKRKLNPRPSSKKTSFYWQVPVAELDTIKEVAVGKILDWRFSDLFFCSGYEFRIAITRKGAGFYAGVVYEGLALDFIQQPDDIGEGLEGAGSYVELDMGSTISAAKWRNRNEGPSNLAKEGIQQSVPVHGAVRYRRARNNNLLGIGPLESGSVLSERLKAAGYVWDGHLHLTTEISLGMGLARHGWLGWHRYMV